MEHFVMKNDAFYILWYVNLYLYMDLMEFEINTIQYNALFSGDEGIRFLQNLSNSPGIRSITPHEHSLVVITAMSSSYLTLFSHYSLN
jgi:hypothetical protein